jgi:hypothetical protein
MRHTHHQPHLRHGGLLPVALVMVMLGGLFLSGWVTLLNTRAVSARNAEYAAKRRLSLENSKALARQLMLERAYSGNSSLSGGIVGQLDGSGPNWGGLNTYSGWSNLRLYHLPPEVDYPATGYQTKVFPYNQLGLRPGATFISAQQVRRPDSYSGTLDPFYSYGFAKGVFPTLAGDAMVIYRKPERESGEIVLDSNFYLDGRLVVRDPASLFTTASVNLGAKVRLQTRSKSFYIQKFDDRNRVTGTTLNGTEQASLNLPCTPSTFGPFPRPAGAAPTTKELFRGELEIIKNTYVPIGLPASVTHHPNCLWQIQEREATSSPVRAAVTTISTGTATGNNTQAWWIEDQTNPTHPPPNWPSGYPPVWKVMFINLSHGSLPNLRIYGVVHQVVLMGQTTSSAYNSAAELDPRIILIVPDAASRAVQDIRFINENNRPLVLGVKGNVRQALGLYWGGTNANTSNLTLDWRVILINEYRQIMCYLPTGGGGPDSVTLTGGVLTNWSFERYDNSSADRFKILPEWNARYNLASALPRESWLESYFQLAAP